jgi:hypothetical protein
MAGLEVIDIGVFESFGRPRNQFADDRAQLHLRRLFARLEHAAGDFERAFLIGQSVVQAVLLLMAATFLFQMPRFSRFLVLLVALRALGVPSSDVSLAEVFASWSASP